MSYRFKVDGQVYNALIPNGKGARNRPKRPSNANVPAKKKRVLKRKIKHKTEITEGKIEIHLPLVTVSEANNFEHWTKKSERHRLQRRVVASFINPVKDKIKLPCEVRLTRIAPKDLDRWDNLPMSVKYILDAICAIITGDFRPGRADGDERITVSYAQKFGREYGVIAEFQSVATPVAPARNDEI